MSSAVPRGQVYFAADLDHPEVRFVDAEEVDGTVVYCHPDDEQALRDCLAQIGERRDIDEWATAVRRRA